MRRAIVLGSVLCVVAACSGGGTSGSVSERPDATTVPPTPVISDLPDGGSTSPPATTVPATAAESRPTPTALPPATNGSGILDIRDEPWVTEEQPLASYVVSGDAWPITTTLTTVSGIAVGTDGSVWAATNHGVARLDPATGAVTGFHRADGLASEMVRDIDIDAKGEVWAATDAGLAHYDGTTWTMLRALGRTDDLREVAVADGVVWFTDGATLGSYDGVSWRVHTPSALIVEWIENLEAVAGSVFIADWNLIRVDTSTMQPVRLRKTPIDLTTAPDGTVWVLGDHTVTHVEEPDTGAGTQWPVPSSGIVAIAAGDDDTAWVSGLAPDDAASPSDVIRTFRLSDGEWTALPDLPVKDGWWQNFLVADGTGNLWLAAGPGIQRWDGTAWTNFDLFEPDLALTLAGLQAAPDGSLVVKSTDGAFAMQVDGRWEVVEMPVFLEATGGTWAFDIGPGGELWTAARNISERASDPTNEAPRGIARFQEGGWTWFGEARGFPSTMAVDVVAAAPDGSVWFADCFCSPEPSIMRMDGSTLTIYGAAQGLSVANLEIAAMGPDGTVWTAGRTGMARWDGAEWEFFTEALLRIPTVERLAVGPDGIAWIGGGGVVASFDGRSLTEYEAPLRGSDLGDMEVTPRGDVWIIPYHDPFLAGGAPVLARLHEGSWTTFDTGDGLPVATIRGIACGADERVWLATPAGIVEVPPPAS